MKTPWGISGRKKFPKLQENAEADVAVIGGGLAGMWCAYLLAGEGKSFVVLEKGRVGEGVAMYTTAFLVTEIDTSLADLKKMFGPKTARLAWESHAKAIDLIKKTAKKENIGCEFMRCSAHIFASREGQWEDIARDYEAAENFEFDTKLRKRGDLPFTNFGAWELKRQAKYHPTKFLSGLANAAARRGVEIFENTEVTDIKKGATMTVKAKNGKRVKVSDVVVATYYPVGSQRGMRLKKGMYVSYALEAEIPKGRIPEGLYWDMADPYTYFRIDAGKGKYDRMILGGADHREELKIPAKKNFAALKDFMQETFPGMKYGIARKWSGPILEPSDGLALIGEVSPHRFVATAFSGNGMTYAVIAGMLISDLIMGRRNELEKVYDPKRRMKPRALAHKARDYAAEFLGGAGKNVFRRVH